MFWGNWALEVVEASEVAEVNETGEVFKAWKIKTVDFRVFQVFEFNDFMTNITLFWCFEKKIFLTESLKLMLNFSTFSVRGRPMFFLKFWFIKLEFFYLRNTQIHTFKQNITFIFLSGQSVNLKEKKHFNVNTMYILCLLHFIDEIFRSFISICLFLYILKLKCKSVII